MKILRKTHALLWLPPLILLCGILMKDLFIPAAQWLADEVLYCPLYEMTGFYCIGCGSTRSVMALLHGEILTAFRQNPIVPLGLLCLLLWYAEALAAHFHRTIRLIPRSMCFWIVVIVIACIWMILRNLFPVMQPFDI